MPLCSTPMDADDAGDVMVWASRKTSADAFTVTAACLFVVLRDETIPCDFYEVRPSSSDPANDVPLADYQS